MREGVSSRCTTKRTRDPAGIHCSRFRVPKRRRLVAHDPERTRESAGRFCWSRPERRSDLAPPNEPENPWGPAEEHLLRPSSAFDRSHARPTA
jgi:hypothetical protein